MPKKVFIAYKHVGENKNDLHRDITEITTALQEINHEPVCMFWRQEEIEENQYDLKQIYKLCAEEISECDQVIFFIKNENESRGMEWELERCREFGIKVCLLIKRGVEYKKFRDNINQIHEFDDLKELNQVLSYI